MEGSGEGGRMAAAPFLGAGEVELSQRWERRCKLGRVILLGRRCGGRCGGRSEERGARDEVKGMR